MNKKEKTPVVVQIATGAVYLFFLGLTILVSGWFVVACLGWYFWCESEGISF